ncbi:MAG: hypothetical protein MJ246_08715 [Clostridia bacterium]|nr:hypothetical protein [Clostridia bacterium]
MSEIQRLECELFDAEVHLDNAKTYIQMKGVNYHTLSIYLEASERVQKIKARLQELQHES